LPDPRSPRITVADISLSVIRSLIVFNSGRSNSSPSGRNRGYVPIENGEVANASIAVFVAACALPLVTIAEATALLGWSRGEMTQAIAAGEIEVTVTSVGKWIWREELMAKALELWSIEAIEEALGADADSVLPDGIRLTDLCVHLPRHHVAMLRHFAERDHTTVSDALARELDGVASANAQELSRSVLGFADALAWPDGETQLPC